jgi:outer membrane protein OmpA-like peptidoglycan-associated protein
MGSQRLLPAAIGSVFAIVALAGLFGATTQAHPPTQAPKSSAIAVEPAQQSDLREEAHDAARQLLAADAQLTNGDLVLAIAAYEGVIASFPNSPEAVTARRRILQARALIKSPPRTDTNAQATPKPAPAPVITAPPLPAYPRSVSPAAVAMRQNEEFKTAVPDRIFFGRNSAALAPADMHVLRQQAQWLLQHKDILLWLEARADDGDSAEIDAALALERGTAVKALLVKEGIDAKRIRMAILGRERPIARCEELAAKARQLLDPAAIDAVEACAAHNRSVIAVVGPEGYAYEPKVAESLRPSDSETTRKSLSEQKAPLRQ